MALPLTAQVNVTSESTVKSDSNVYNVPVQKLEISNNDFKIRYDFKAGGPDIAGVFIPKIISDSSNNLGCALIKTGDGNKKDQLVTDLWANRTWGKKLYTGIEVGRIVGPTNKPWDFIVSKVSYGPFTAEGGILAYHPLTDGINSKDAIYAWAAYHPEHAYVALGKQINTYWAFVGTKNLKKFGNLTFGNYDTKTNNFWFKSQTGLGEINQGFFSQDMYIEATSYLVVPPFFYKHFSPLTTKGTYSIKMEGRRTNGVHGYEVMGGQIIGNNILQLGVGINSEYKNDKLKLGPAIELYKSWKIDNLKGSIELRHDFLYQATSAYITIKY